MTTAIDFKTLIADTPELPSDLYTSIENDIKHTRRARPWLFAMAAALLLSLVTLGTLQLTKQPIQTTEALPEEVLHELETASAYLNAEDMETYTALYTFIDN